MTLPNLPPLPEPADTCMVGTMCMRAFIAEQLYAYAQSYARTCLAAAVGEPYCWVIPGDNANANGFIDATVCREGEFTKPLYTRGSDD